MDIKEILKVFEGLEFGEEQEKGLRSFFEAVKEKVRASVVAEYEEEMQALNEELEETKNNNELYSPENVQLAADKLKEDCEAAALLMVEDKEKEDTRKMASALEDLYKEIEERVKADFYESKEYKALIQVSEAMKLINVNEDNEALHKKIDELSKENENLKTETKVLGKKEIINDLIKGFNESHQQTIREFLEGAKEEDEIYDRFSAIAEIIKNEEVSTGSGRKFGKLKKEKEALNNDDADEKPADNVVASESKDEDGEEKEQIDESTTILGLDKLGLKGPAAEALGWLLRSRQAQ